nr:hypothetical protein CFP56_17292 [Quercus suber]
MILYVNCVEDSLKTLSMPCGIVKRRDVFGARISTYGSFLDLVELCLTKPGVGELFRTTSWFIWTHQNKVKLREKTLPLSSVREAAKNLLQQVQSVREVRNLVKQPRKCKWFPPTTGDFKANFNGAWFNESEEAGIGIVGRESLGQVLATLA